LKQSLKVKQTHKTYGYPEQISAAKSKVIKYLDEIEERLITEVESVQEKNEEKINSEKHEICQLLSLIYI
jgi:hypothetical protein